MTIHLWFPLANNLRVNIECQWNWEIKGKNYENHLCSSEMYRSQAPLPYPWVRLWWKFSLASAIWLDDFETTLGHEPPLSRYAVLILREKIHPGSAFAEMTVPALATVPNWMWFWKKKYEEMRKLFCKMSRLVAIGVWRIVFFVSALLNAANLITCISFVFVSLCGRRRLRMDSNDYTYMRRPT